MREEVRILRNKRDPEREGESVARLREYRPDCCNIGTDPEGQALIR